MPLKLCTREHEHPGLDPFMACARRLHASSICQPRRTTGSRRRSSFPGIRRRSRPSAAARRLPELTSIHTKPLTSKYYVDGDLPSMAIFRFFLGEPSPDNVSLHHRAHAEFELRQSCRQDAPLQAAALHAVLATLHAPDTLAAPNSSTGPRI